MLSKMNPINWCHFQHQQKYFCMELYKKNKNALLWYIQVIVIYGIQKWQT